MENDSSTLFYIIAVAVYFIYSLFFRKKEEGPVEGDPDSPGEPKKPVSFEELLKEIRQEQGGQQEETQGAEEIWEEDEHDEYGYEYEEEPEVPATTSYEQPYRGEARYYEGSWESKKRYNTQTQPLVKLDDQVDLNDTETVLGEVEEEDSGKANKFAELLKSPETLQDAIIVSEIINRKYF